MAKDKKNPGLEAGIFEIGTYTADYQITP